MCAFSNGHWPYKNDYDLADPLSLAKQADIPLLLIQGDADSMAISEDSRKLYESLCGEGKPVSYLELPGVDHAFDLFSGTVQSNRVEAEIAGWLKAADSYNHSR